MPGAPNRRTLSRAAMFRYLAAETRTMRYLNIPSPPINRPSPTFYGKLQFPAPNSGSLELRVPSELRWSPAFNSLILAYDRSRTGGADRRSAGRKAGYKQLVRDWAGRRPRAPSAARATGPLTLRGQLVKLDREHWSIPKKLPTAGTTRDNLSPAASICIATATASSAPIEDPAPGLRPWGGGRYFHSAQRDQRRHAGRPGAGRSRTAQSRRPPQGRIVRFSSAATPPSSARLSLRAIRSRYRQNVVIPFDERMTQPILIPPGAGDSRCRRNLPRRIAFWAVRGTAVQNLKARTWKAWSSTSRSPVGPRPRVPPSAASLKSSALPTTSASTSR
jgi:hypothetical protein